MFVFRSSLSLLGVVGVCVLCLCRCSTVLFVFCRCLCSVLVFVFVCLVFACSSVCRCCTLC